MLRAQRPPARPKLAAICTTYFKYSHSQHIVDRFLEGYGWNGTHHHPEMDLVSIYIDQIGDNDVSKSRLQQFPTMKLYPTIAEALTLGGSTRRRRGGARGGARDAIRATRNGRRSIPDTSSSNRS